MTHFADDQRFMERAFALAALGLGYVEPNPLVGCVVVSGGETVGEGWHQQFGGPHAEIEALAVAGDRARGATVYVSLEPCCHHGKTGPCTKALIAAGVVRVVVGCQDPNPQIAGRGLAELRAAGIEVVTDILRDKATDLIAPFAKLVTKRQPWVIAKWAMTLDGKIATRTGDSRWITGEKAREAVHEWRGKMDAILVGRGTAEADDPLLTARPPGPRTPTRIVLDTLARLSPQSKLVSTAHEAPVLIAVGPDAPTDRRNQLVARGAEVIVLEGNNRKSRLHALLGELGTRQFTNLMVEGGAEVLGAFQDAGAIDEVRAFIAPRILGGHNAPSAIAGTGPDKLCDALQLSNMTIEQYGEDLLFSGRVRR